MNRPDPLPAGTEPGRSAALATAVRVFPLVLLAVGVGLTVGIHEGDLNPREVLLILGLGGALATYRVVLAARPVSLPARQVGFWITLPLVAVLVVVAPMFALYALAGFFEAVILFAGLAEWVADASTSAICVLAVTGGVGTTLSSWATRAALYALFLVTARLVRPVLRSVAPHNTSEGDWRRAGAGG